MFNPDDIKRDFPLFSHHPDLAFLDSAASSQRPRHVIDAMDEYYREYNANIHRGIYKLSEKATARYEEAREKVARFISAHETAEVIFTRNATEAINLIAYSWGRTNLKKGDGVLITQMEHHANIVPWQMLQQITDCRLQIANISSDYTLNVESYKKKLASGRVKLVALTHVSNVFGTINPIKELIRIAHDAGALVLIDGAQAIPHLAVNVQDLDADFYVFSGHKMLGPTGIGVLFGKRSILESMPPFMGGGDMIREVTFDRTTYNELPWKFEAGTPHIAGAIGLGAATDYLQTLGIDNVREHEVALTQYALQRMQTLDGVTLYGPTDSSVRGGVVAFTIGSIHPHDIASIFDENGIAIRAGHHCAMPLHRLLGISASARLSFYIYNTKEDIDRAVDAIEKIKKMFTE